MIKNIKQKITSSLKEISKLSKNLKIASFISVTVTAIFIMFIANILKPNTINYSYGQKTCSSQIRLLPDILKIDNNSIFNVVNNKKINIGDFSLLSTETCFEPKDKPTPGSYNLSSTVLNGLFSANSFNIIVGSAPEIKTVDTLSKPVIIDSSLIFSTEIVDKTYNYLIKINNTSIDCQNNEKYIECPLKTLHLSMGKEYNIIFYRLFKDTIVETLAEQKIYTRSELNISSANITDNQVLYDDTHSFSVHFNKPVQDVEVKITDIKSNKIYTTKNSIEDSTVIISTTEDLERNSNYTLGISSAVAKDGSKLSSTQQYHFSTAGGPSYLSSDAPNFGLSLDKTITLTFDQNINETQNIQNYISVTGINSTISKYKNTVLIRYSNAPPCTRFTITINPGLKSPFGYTQSRSWVLNSRTQCQISSIIGYSAEGRSINAYKFGQGNKAILFIGAIHGNESSTKYLMNEWINELERNYDSIPQNKTVVIIPTLNIDGAVNKNRYNTHGIDLNRNFPAKDWQTNIYSLSNQLLPGGGGFGPLSEPESQALAQLSQSLSPKLVMSFHSAAGCVIGNLAGNSTSLADTYSRLSGYRNATGVNDTFSYPITGSYDDWLRDEYNTTSVLVELSSNTESQFYKNKNALWAMVNS